LQPKSYSRDALGADAASMPATGNGLFVRPLIRIAHPFASATSQDADYAQRAVGDENARQRIQ
jgi:hypothetical protein